MKDYVVKESDILDKIATVYIEDHLVLSWPYRHKQNDQSVFEQIKDGSTPIHVKQYNKIPSIGMIYKDGVFTNGENGETFIDVNNGIPNGALVEGSNEAMVSVSPSGVVDGCMIVFMKYKNWVNENFAALFAALMSNPTIVIKDNYDNEFDHLNNPKLIGTIKQIPELSDFDFFYSRWEGS